MQEDIPEGLNRQDNWLHVDYVDQGYRQWLFQLTYSIDDISDTINMAHQQNPY